MGSNENQKNNSSIVNDNDTFDINELAAIGNEEVSVDLIEQLQNQIAKNSNIMNNDDATGDGNLFEEVSLEKPLQLPQEDEPEKKASSENMNKNIDDNYVKKYKARLNKVEKLAKEENNITEEKKEIHTPVKKADNTTKNTVQNSSENNIKNANSEISNTNNNVDNVNTKVAEQQENRKTNPVENNKINPETDCNNIDTTIGSEQKNINISSVAGITPASNVNSTNKNISELSRGKITESKTTENEIAYMDSLNTLDDNVNYSKYVIYIDPENVEFIESLTVKERKNLINKLLKDQDSISNTKIKAGFIYTVIKHAFVAIITLALAIPAIYIAINTSLEATIDNYRQSQSLFKVLYKEHGKIKSVK